LGHTPDFELQDWFKRPVKILTQNWTEGGSLATSFDPWSLYFSNPEVYAKLKGFSRLQATLHVKLTINASPYQYGLGMMSYYPLNYSTFTFPTSGADDRFAGGVTDPSLASYTGGTEVGNLIVNSCRPHGYFYPQFSRGCEMVLPFCYYKNWVNLDSTMSEVKQLGRLNLYSPRNLLTAGTAATQPITITIYAWAEDMKLSGPSYTLQSDEYAERPVSTACSLASQAAANLSVVPRVGPYAMATSTVFSAMGSVARWFGYTNPPVIADVHANRINYMPAFASPEICVQNDKLALDPKNEVTVDSRTVGLDGTDHMALSHVLKRDVAFGIFDWSASATPTTPLFMVHVDPMVYTSRDYNGDVTGLAVKSIQMTPSCQVGSVFDMWTGPITYSFTSVSSQFHRGRLLVSYDPDGFSNSYTSAAYTGPRTITKVWDLAECPEFKFEVPYMAPTAYLKTGGTRHVCTAGQQRIFYKNPTLPGTFAYRDGNQNGSIIVSVLNALTSSSPSANVYIVCGINCGGLEFANPREIEIPMSNYALQSNELSTEANEQTYADVKVVSSHHNEIYTGEIARSFRQLLHRTNLYTRYCAFGGSQKANTAFSDKIPNITVAPSAALSTPTSIEGYSSSFLTPALPLMTGSLYDSGTSFSVLNNSMVKNGTTSFVAADQVTGTNIGIPTMTAYLASSYVGWRGSHVYTARLAQTDLGTTASQPAMQATDLSISRFFRCISRLIIPNSAVAYDNNMKTAYTWRIFKESDVTSTVGAVANIQFFNLAKMSTGFSSNGTGGFAVTNPTNVNVVDAVVPYYNHYRMLPCNPCCNLFSNYDWNSISWNAFDDNVENVLNPMVAINTTVNAVENLDNNIANLSRHPTVDIYHKAGPDFSFFWYLNPPSIYVYSGKTDGYPIGWT
jgi:hypothetical protein